MGNKWDWFWVGAGCVSVAHLMLALIKAAGQ